ncbi:MAG: ArsR/SmtB family transcription factor [Candidatus Limnocylindria bacterium]
MAVLELPVRERGVCCEPRRRMKPERVDQLTPVLKALADPTRLEMVAILRDADQPLCVCDFTTTFGLSQPTVSHHMGRLRDAGLVESTKAGIWAFYSLRKGLPPPVKRLVDAL